MIFKPESSKLWDTFILCHENQFFLFYLQCRHDYWDGYGLAVSSDLLHWRDMGTVLELDSGSGTGMVYRVGEEWVLSYCSMKPGEPHHICFACSDDLYHWVKMPPEYNLYPDLRWYDAAAPGKTSSRFGDFWVERQADGSYVGFLTASADGGPAGANGVVGFAKSADGLHWTCEPPVNAPCGMGWAELGAHVEFHNRHYLLVGAMSCLGARFDPVYNETGKAGGMYVLVSDDLSGPYRLADGDPLLLGCRNAPPNWAYLPAYYTRVFRLNGQTLLHHHWMPRENMTDASLSVCKIIEEQSPGKLRLTWWPGNEKLKGDMLFDIGSRPEMTMPKANELPTGTADYSACGFALETGSTALAYSDTQELTKGIVVEASFVITGNGAAGLFFGTEGIGRENPCEGVACLCNTRRLVEFGSISSCVCSPAFMVESHVPWLFSQGRAIHMRLLIKGEFAELYIDDRLVQCYGFRKPVLRSIGVFAEACKVEIKTLRAWQFV